jgi:hypothetical protein
MLLLPGLLLALVVFVHSGPDIPLRRMLHERLVEAPAKWLLQCGRHSLPRAILLSALLIACGALLFTAPELLLATLMGGADAMLVIGPEAALWYAADLTLYFDALAVSYLLATASKVRMVARVIHMSFVARFRNLARLFRSTPRQRTSRPHALRPRADNDDDGEGRPRLLLAA